MSTSEMRVGRQEDQGHLFIRNVTEEVRRDHKSTCPCSKPKDILCLLVMNFLALFQSIYAQIIWASLPIKIFFTYAPSAG